MTHALNIQLINLKTKLHFLKQEHTYRLVAWTTITFKKA